MSNTTVFPKRQIRNTMITPVTLVKHNTQQTPHVTLAHTGNSVLLTRTLLLCSEIITTCGTGDKNNSTTSELWSHMRYLARGCTILTDTFSRTRVVCISRLLQNMYGGLGDFKKKEKSAQLFHLARLEFHDSMTRTLWTLYIVQYMRYLGFWSCLQGNFVRFDRKRKTALNNSSIWWN